MTRKFMFRFCIHIIPVLLVLQWACVKKAEEMVGPTIGSLDLIADESIKDIVEQEEEIFERTYPYANLTITYLNEYDMFQKVIER